MAMPTKFTVPWEQIDPSLQHGGIAGELTDFVGPDLGDNTTTRSMDLYRIFRTLNDVTASVSMHPGADVEGYPRRALIEEMLSGMNLVMEFIVDVTKTCSTRDFNWTHAIPPSVSFVMRPIRFPLRNEAANEYLHYCLGDHVEVAELNRNGNHSSLDPQSADRLIAPLYHWKAKLMKLYFDLEVEGEMSREELNAMMDKTFRPGPTVSPPDASAERPTAQELADAYGGAPVIQWAPDAADWAVFASLQDKRYTPERIYQPEGKRPTTEDVAPDTPGVVAGSGGASQP